MVPIASINEGSSADSGNLGSSRMELKEELKSSARSCSGLWRRGILGLGREENIAPEGLFGFLPKKIYSSSRHFHFFFVPPFKVLIYASPSLLVSHKSKLLSIYQHVIRAGWPKHVVQKRTK